MKTNPHSTTRSLVLAALFLALAFVLPMITGHVPQVGNMLCPMHFPILLCGFVLGGPWGLAVGFIAPLVRSVLSQGEAHRAHDVRFSCHRHGGRPFGLGYSTLCAGRPDRFQLPVQRVFVRCAAHRRAGHRGSAGAHPADSGGFAEGKGHRLSSRYAKRAVAKLLPTSLTRCHLPQ